MRNRCGYWTLSCLQSRRISPSFSFFGLEDLKEKAEIREGLHANLIRIVHVCVPSYCMHSISLIQKRTNEILMFGSTAVYCLSTLLPLRFAKESSFGSKSSVTWFDWQQGRRVNLSKSSSRLFTKESTECYAMFWLTRQKFGWSRNMVGSCFHLWNGRVTKLRGRVAL